MAVLQPTPPRLLDKKLAVLAVLALLELEGLTTGEMPLDERLEAAAAVVVVQTLAGAILDWEEVVASSFRLRMLVVHPTATMERPPRRVIRMAAEGALEVMVVPLRLATVASTAAVELEVADETILSKSLVELARLVS